MFVQNIRLLRTFSYIVSIIKRILFVIKAGSEQNIIASAHDLSDGGLIQVDTDRDILALRLRDDLVDRRTHIGMGQLPMQSQ